MILTLDGNGPLHRQTYRVLRQRILDGVLRPGARLPASRSLAREAGLSRNTVLQAYEQLEAEGYTLSRRGSGTFVAKALPDPSLAVGSSQAAAPHSGVGCLRRSAYAERVAAIDPQTPRAWGVPRRHLLHDFRYGEPAYDDLPIATWSRLLAKRVRDASAASIGYSRPGGAPELRSAIAEYLGRARGVLCEPDQVVVVYGTQQAIDLSVRVLVDPGDRVAIEEPHYTGVSWSLAAAGAEIVSVPVDEEGLNVDVLARSGPLRGVFTTPSHQFPLGATLPLARRLALLEVANAEDAFILEDDYDSEFRFDGRPLECLQGLDRSGRVLYAGSTSKLVFPALRLGWLIVPPGLVEPMLAAKALADTGSAGLEQLALADFIAEGHLERHLRRSRVRVGARREALLEAIETHLGDRAVVSGTHAGLHVLVWLPGLAAKDMPALRRRCASRSVGIYPIEPYFSAAPPQAGFLLGYAALPEDVIRDGIRKLAETLSEFETS